ncbi:MAG: tRNA 2-thiouridine(34) synthase MnmA [Thermoleophilia bacterium]
MKAAVKFSGETLTAALSAEGASTALAAADARAGRRVAGVDWRAAAAISAGGLEDEVARNSGRGGQQDCPPERAAFFAVDALHRALEDSLRRGSFPHAPRQEERVLVAMSGGVDSSTACLLEQQAGREVVGVTMRLWSDPDCEAGETSCCSPSAVADARGVCHQLGVPHLTVDCADAFEHDVVEYFVEEYREGRTPNPCTHCNGRFRFPYLATLADMLGASVVATGHYARVLPCPGPGGSTLCLARGKDALKDQSYVLWAVDPGLLARIEFPLGGLRKTQTRALAAEAGLIVKDRPESQEVCFIPDDDYRRFLRTRITDLPGDGEIVDSHGNVLGRHDSFIDFTVGQRRGLGVSAAEPLYVLGTEPDSNRVIVGHRHELAVEQLQLAGINLFLHREEIVECLAQVRYNSPPIPARVAWEGDIATVDLSQPAYGVAPGQSTVLYRDDIVIGGGVIVKSG